MYKAVLSLTVVFILFLSSAILAEADFLGYVDYKNCDCEPVHRVKIKKADGTSEDYHRVRCSGNPGYNSGMYSYTTGWYYISVVGLGGTECEASELKYVYHIAGEPQQVDLAVYGPQGQPNAPGGGE